MAHPKRFELLTPRFVVWCSIQLSYGCLPKEGGHIQSAPEGCKPVFPAFCSRPERTCFSLSPEPPEASTGRPYSGR